MKDVIVIGGPNGAGKTSWALRQLPSVVDLREFVNADEIAHGLSPLNPDGSAMAAGRIMLERVHALVDAGASFAFETTCAGRTHAGLLKRCRASSYRITLVFLWLPSADAALDRVARRVSEGGHDVPATVVRRRYALGLRNMRHIYLPLADIAYIYDNSDLAGICIAERRQDRPVQIHDHVRWSRIEETTR